LPWAICTVRRELRFAVGLDHGKTFFAVRLLTAQGRRTKETYFPVVKLEQSKKFVDCWKLSSNNGILFCVFQVAHKFDFPPLD
jgi:hypothetical protein